MSRFTLRHALWSIVFACAWPATASARQHSGGASEYAAGPEFVHEVWTVRDGLPVNSINALLQSRNGYIWAATYDGLVRFDGVRFTVYNTGNTDGLLSNRILDLTQTRDGSLWLRTEQGYIVQVSDGRFTRYGEDDGVDNGVNVIYEDSHGRIWIGTEGGLALLREGRFTNVASDTIRGKVRSILERRDGTIWAGTEGFGLYRVEGASATTFPASGELATETVLGLYEDSDGSLWIGTPRAAYRHTGSLERVAPEERPSDYVYAFMTSPATGSTWMAGQAGMYRFDGRRAALFKRETRLLLRQRLMQTDASGHVWYVSGTSLYREGVRVHTVGPRLANDAGATSPGEISAFVVDHEGSIWIGTHSAGLHRLKQSAFTVYSEPEGLGDRNVYAVLEDGSGNIWLGTLGGGVSRITRGRVTTSTAAGAPLLATALLEDEAGRVWVGGLDGQLVVCSPREPRCSPAEFPAVGLTTVAAMHSDRHGVIWLGTDHGLFRNRSGEWSSFDPASGAPVAVVRAFLETADGALWMGTNGGGLFRYDAGRFIGITTADGLPSDLIRSLHQDADGWLWVGTEGRGLARLDPREWTSQPKKAGGSSVITSYRRADGLFDEVIHQILEDDAGRLWMSSNRGIFWVARTELEAFAAGKTERINSTAYTERDGLRNREANGGFHPAGVKARDGRLWFPTQDGVAVVDPRSIARNLAPPPVVIEEVSAHGLPISPQNGRIELGVGQRDLQIAYTGLSLLAPENVRFRYRLEGYDADWIDAGTRRTAYYTQVPPGRYVFRVTASNNAGVWNDDGDAIEVRLAAAFYETVTFRLLLVLSLVFATFLGFRWRLRMARLHAARLTRLVDERTLQLREREHRLELQNAQLEAQAEKLADLDQAKSRFFANISHEFRTPLTLTIGPLEDLRARYAADATDEAPRKLDTALRNSRRLLRLVNQVLDVAKLESGHVHLELRRANLVSFVRGIVAAFAPLAERRHISLAVDAVADEILADFDPGALEKVFTNLLSNAFKFTPAGGNIAVEFELEPSPEAPAAAHIRIRDSGRGIRPEDLPHVFERFYHADESVDGSQPGTGIGLSLALELVELHGGTIRAASRPGAGATFTVSLPRPPADAPSEPIAAAGGEISVAAEPLAAEFVRDEPPASPIQPVAAGAGEDVTTILIVDDSADLRAYVRDHLGAHYRVAEAADGAEGLATARRILPDLIVSDVMMPVLDGHQLSAALRASPETDFIPLILLTARADSDQRIAGLKGGADDYIVKPFDMKELKARADNLIASRRRLRERFGGSAALELRPIALDVSASDRAFIERVRTAIEANLENSDFGVAELAQAVFQDRSHMYRRIQTLFGESPSDLIRRLRIDRATALLLAGSGSVAEVAYAVGFNSVAYFHRCFRDAHGVTPAAYRDAVARR